MSSRPPRDYQKLAVRYTLDQVVRGGGRNLYYTLPTGTGKTRVATMLIEELYMRGRVLVVAHRRELVEQMEAAIFDDTENRPGVVMADFNDHDRHIIIATVQSLNAARLAGLFSVNPNPIKYLLIDECHHAVPRSRYVHVIEYLRSVYPELVVIGCTATPYRNDAARMQNVLPDCTFVRTIPDMQKAGYLAPLLWKAVKVPVSFDQVTTGKTEGEKDYNAADLVAVLSPQSEYIAKQTAPSMKHRPSMVFSATVAHAYELAEAYRACGIVAVAIDGDTPAERRRTLLEQWKRGEIQCVVNCALFTEGFDYTPLSPNVNGLGCLVIARPTMSPSLYMQMIGRGTRLKPASGEFADCLCFDVASNANLLETKQVTLPSIMQASVDDGQDLDHDEILFDGESARKLSNKKVQDDDDDKRPHTLKIKDGLAVSWISWGHQRELDVYYTEFGDTKEISVYAVVFPEPETGMYVAKILTHARGSRDWSSEDVTERAKPLNEIMHHMNHLVSQHGIKALLDKKAKWRKAPASDKQLDLLSRVNYTAYETAVKYHWNKGEVDQVLTWSKVRYQVQRLLIEASKEAAWKVESISVFMGHVK